MNDNVINNWDKIPEWKTGKSQISPIFFPNTV